MDFFESFPANLHGALRKINTERQLMGMGGGLENIEQHFNTSGF